MPTLASPLPGVNAPQAQDLAADHASPGVAPHAPHAPRPLRALHALHAPRPSRALHAPRPPRSLHAPGPPSSLRALGALTLAAAAALFGADAQAQTLVHEFTGDSGRDRFGQAFDAADWDGDGTSDLIIGAAWDDAAGSAAGRVVVRSGIDGSTLDQWFGAAPGDVFGALVAVVGDLNTDGHLDLLVGAPGVEQPGGFSHEGQAVIISGRSGAVLRTHPGPTLHEEFGGTGGAVGDVDGDGVGDYGLGSLWIWDAFEPTPFQGDTTLFSGASGAALPALPINGGHELVAAGDVDDDGTGDWLAVRFPVEWGHEQAQLRSGGGDAVLDSAGGPGDLAYAGPTGDVTGDGLPGYAFAWGPWNGAQSLELRGVSGTHAALTLDPVQVALHGQVQALDGRADLNGDGTPDLLVGLPHAGDPLGLASAGQVRVLSGTDLSELLRIEGQVDRAELGKVVRALGDLDGDGCADWACAAPAPSAFSPGLPGVVRVYSGGALGWIDHDGALAGAAGEPLLEGSGFLKPGSLAALDLSGAAPSASVALVAGFAHLAAPLKGGVLGPSPDVVLFGLATDGAGALSLSTPWPSLPPATSVWFQEWVQDAGAPHGWAASNTVSATNAP